MAFLDNAGLGTLWAKIKATFGASLDVSNATITLKSGAATPTNLSQVTIPDATTSTPGVMTAAMVSKLNGIDAGANFISVDESLSSTSTNPVENRAVTKAIYDRPTTTEVNSIVGNLSSSLATVARSGAYADLTGKPTIPTDYWSTNTKYNPHYVLIGPSSGTASNFAAFRALVEADIPNLSASKITSGAFDSARIPGLAASKITSGTFAAARIPDLTVSKITDFSTEVNNLISAAQVGASVFQGTVSSDHDISDSEYRKGWYWVVSSAGTYVGQPCEPGDMIFAIEDKANGAYKQQDFSVVQNNLTAMTTTEINGILV